MASDDEETNSNEEEYERQEGKSGIIFLIDSRSSMFTKDIEDSDNELTRFNLALKCCRAQLLNKIIAKQRDLVGVVLFGTGKSDPETKTKHVSLLLELNYPGAPAIKQLDRLLEDPDSQEIQSNYGSSEDFLLADALWFSSSLLARNRTQLNDKRILLFTDDCDPHGSHPDRAHMARKRAKDLNKVQINLEIIPIGSTDFNYSVFYKELVETVNGQQDDTFDPDPSSRLEELLERVNRLEFRRRRYAKIKWNLGNDVLCGVSLYTLYREASILPAQPLSRATNEPVTRLKQTYDQATGELLLPSDIEEFLSIAGTEVVFSREERDALNKVMEPGITLLGFKPSSAVKEGQHCGQPSFIFPEETLIKGSRKLMKALVERCIAKQKVAVVCMTPRYRAVTKYFYLVPSEETYDDSGFQLTPCGFHAIPIPFDNEIREQTFEYSSHVNPSTLELVKKVVTKLKMSFKPCDFQNPKLQLFWGHLEALALEYPAPDGVEDSTVPDIDAQTARLQSLVAEFNNSFELEGCQTVVTKRERESKAYSGPSKRAKRDDEIDIREAIKTKKVEKFTVAEIKQFLNDNNIKTTHLKKKADYVEAVYNMKC